jgi:N-acetylneuraminate synthase
MIIAEIGINHNGDINIAKKLIDIAVISGCDYVKFQKRNPDICVPEKQKYIQKDTPWGAMTYLEYKHRLEFTKDEYMEINSYCKSRNIKWFASVWDLDSLRFMINFVDIVKIPSALITNIDLCKQARDTSKTLMISTGMSTESEIITCITSCNPDIIMHTNSVYPSVTKELNLNYIQRLKRLYPDKIIGYSGHEYGLVSTFAAVAIGATVVERHITIDRRMWGSDHAASIEPEGIIKLVRGVNDVIDSMGTDAPRVLSLGENKKKETLRG